MSATSSVSPTGSGQRAPTLALDALTVGITRRKLNLVLDGDVRDFFTSLDHSWL